MDQRIYYGDVEHFSIPLWARIVIKVNNYYLLLMIIELNCIHYTLNHSNASKKRSNTQKYSYLLKLSNTLSTYTIILNNIQIEVSHLLLAVSSASNIIIYSYQVDSKVLHPPSSCASEKSIFHNTYEHPVSSSSSSSPSNIIIYSYQDDSKVLFQHPPSSILNTPSALLIINPPPSPPPKSSSNPTRFSQKF